MENSSGPEALRAPNLTPLDLAIGWLREAIAAGRYAPGRPAPSVRTLQRLAGVARNTAQAALQQLRDEGAIVFDRSLGRYLVTDDLERDQRRECVLDAYIRGLFAELRQRGFSADEIFGALRRFLPGASQVITTGGGSPPAYVSEESGNW